MTNFLDIKKKKVFVFGGSGLIGNKISKDLREFGAKVVIIDLKKKRNFDFFKIDLKKTSLLQKNINKLIKKYGCPDVVINTSYPKTKNWASYKYLNQINHKSLETNLRSHLFSYVLVSMELANYMKKSKIKGSIINVSSIYGLVGQDTSIYANSKIKENFIYTTIKHGINGLTRQLSSSYGKFGIRSNAICPGGVLSENLKKNKSFIKQYLKRNPIKKMCSVSDVSNLLLFLSSERSSYINGELIRLDGGRLSI